MTQRTMKMNMAMMCGQVPQGSFTAHGEGVSAGTGSARLWSHPTGFTVSMTTECVSDPVRATLNTSLPSPPEVAKSHGVGSVRDGHESS